MLTALLRSPRFVPTLLAGLAVLALPQWGRAEEPTPEESRPQLAEKTSTAIQGLAPLVNDKKWEAAVELLSGLLPGVDATSYDACYVEDTLGKVYWQGMDKPELAVPYFKKVIELTEKHPNYISKTDRIEHIKWVSQIYYMQGSAIKGDMAKQRELYDQSLEWMRTWLTQTKPKSEDELFYATLLYFKASGAGEKGDLETLKEARAATEKGLVMDIKPKDTFYQLLIAECQLLGDLKAAGDYLEFLVKQKPTSKDYWTQLMAIYNNEAGNEKNPKEQRIDYARAINAVERAQSYGFLKTPKDNYNLVSMYNQVGQFGKATELLYSGLKNGGIESDQKNWLALGYFYQQIDETQQAIKVLKEAEELFPTSGDIDRQIADLYYQDDHTQEVYEYAKKAVAKGNLTTQKPFTTYQLLAFSAYELGKYDEALAACTKAISFPNSSKELKTFKLGIEAAIKAKETPPATSAAL